MTWSCELRVTTTGRLLRSQRADAHTTKLRMRMESSTMRGGFLTTRDIWRRWRRPCRKVPTSADITHGACSITSNGRKATASALDSPTWITKRRRGRSKNQESGTRRLRQRIVCRRDGLRREKSPLHLDLVAAIRNLQPVALFRQLPL